MKKLILIFTAVFTAVFINAAINSSAGIMFPLLDMGVGARALGMGGAYTAIADDASAVHWNPAGLAQVKDAEISLAYDKWFMDTSNQQVIFAVPLGNGAIAGEVVYMNLGTFERLNESGNNINASIYPYNILGSMGYGTGIMPGISAGISIKIISQSTGTKSYTGFAGDLGALYKNEIMSAGISLQNAGSAAGFSLPMKIDAGAAFKAINTGENRVLIAADVNYLFKDSPALSVGAEYVFSNIIAARAGYNIRFGENNLDGLTGISGGIGLNIASIKLDYAIVPYGDLGTTHRATLTYQFGSSNQAPPSIKKSK
jgi:long-subunit fatty acid transport protein